MDSSAHSFISQNIFSVVVTVVKIHTTPHDQQIQLFRIYLGGINGAMERPSNIYLRFNCFHFNNISVQICSKIKHGLSDSLFTGYWINFNYFLYLFTKYTDYIFSACDLHKFLQNSLSPVKHWMKIVCSLAVFHASFLRILSCYFLFTFSWPHKSFEGSFIFKSGKYGPLLSSERLAKSLNE